MGDRTAEQAEEIEALESIYSTDFEKLTDSPPFSYKITLTPNPGSDNNHVALSLVFTIPQSYPSVVPLIAVELIKGLGAKHKEEITKIIETISNENIDIPSAYVIAAVREWLVDNNVAGQDGSMYADMMRRMQQKDVDKKKKEAKTAIAVAADREVSANVGLSIDPIEEEIIRKRQAGVPVTVESFLAWRTKFEIEMAEQRSEYAFGGLTKEQLEKPTGKQLFLSNCAGLEEALIAAEESKDAELIAAAMSIAARRARGEVIDDEEEATVLGLKRSGEKDDMEQENVNISEDIFLGDDDDDDDFYLDDDDEADANDEDYDDDEEA